MSTVTAWADAYDLERRARLREIRKWQSRCDYLETQIVIASATAALLRAQLKDAGITPLDEADEPEEEFSPFAEEAQ